MSVLKLGSFDASATGFKAIAGWRFIDWLAVEANYVDLGSGDDNVLGTRVESDVNGVSLSAVGFVPVGPVDLFARVGAKVKSLERVALGPLKLGKLRAGHFRALRPDEVLALRRCVRLG